MILCIDVGNTNIKYGLFEGDELIVSFRGATELKRTSDEYGTILTNMLAIRGISKDAIGGAIISSVVPALNYTVQHMCTGYLGVEPLMVGAGLKTGHNLRVDDAREVGADRIVNDVAAIRKYGAPLIVIDFGTATTFNAINEQGEFIGGAVAPGIRGSVDSLVSGTAKLPRVEIETPRCAIGKNTTTNMQSGIVFGHVGLVTYLIGRMREELGAPKAKVVATGGLALLVSNESDVIDVLDGLLTLKGLRLIYERNVGA